MAGSLIKIDETTVSSAVASVTLTGIDSTYDVYLLTLNNVSPATLNADVFLRVTESGTASSDSDYDLAYKLLRTDTTFTNINLTNQAQWGISGSLENEAGKLLMDIVIFSMQTTVQNILLLLLKMVIWQMTELF